MKKTACQSFAVNISLLRPDAADLVARAHEKFRSFSHHRPGIPERIAHLFVRQRSILLVPWCHR
ncbi:MAG: hypothetical protein R2860_00240 [Desulfobacterales bacterium]